MDGNELWSRDIGLERKGRNGKTGGKMRYIRWVLGLERRTPEYMVREEIKRGKLRERAGRRAWGFEKRLEEGRGNELTRSCWRELRERAREGKVGSEWDEERRRFFEDKKWEIRELERKREEGDRWFGELIRKDKEEQRLKREREREE